MDPLFSACVPDLDDELWDGYKGTSWRETEFMESRQQDRQNKERQKGR